MPDELQLLSPGEQQNEDEDQLRRRSTSRSSSHRLSIASVDSNRKGRSLEGSTHSAIADRPNFASPTSQSWRTSLQQMQRRPSASSGYSTVGSDAPPPSKSGFLNSWATIESHSEDKTFPSPASSHRNSISEGSSAVTSRALAAGEADRFKSSAHAPSFSIGSSIMSTSWGSAPSTTSSIAGSEHNEEKSTVPRNSTPIQTAAEGYQQRVTAGEDVESLSAITAQPSSPMGPPARSQTFPRKMTNRVSASRRLSGVTATTGTNSPNSELGNTKSDAYLGVLGICALESKARSKPSRNILNRINAQNEFEVVMFGDKIILDEEPENWPLCDYLISFFSEGFPLHKAIEYVRLRKPFTVNDLPMQTVLWDRRICLKILDRFQVLTPSRLEVTRDGGPRAETSEIAQHIFDRTGLKLPSRGDDSDSGVAPPKEVYMKDSNTLYVDGKDLTKPFVEKPVSGEDHNIRIYSPNGGGRRLFRKINNKSSEADDTLDVPRCITEPGTSYLYEAFLATKGNEDVKAYTVGSNYCHAETRKSPTVDGIVKRNTHGKEVRYVAELTEEEKKIASTVAEAFGQRVCGFDLLRAHGHSYVIDVNGWSFVKDNNAYYDKCSEILRDMFVTEKLRREGRAALFDGDNTIEAGLPNRPSGVHFSTLKSILKSPSMSRLAGNHQHSSKVHPDSDISTQTSPLISPPSIERPAGAKLPAAYASMPAIMSAPSLPLPNSVSKEASPPVSAEEEISAPLPPPAVKSQWKLKGMVAVVRHADRTPKQKFKFTFHTKPFIDLLRGHQEEVLLTGEAALYSVQEAVKAAFKEGVEDPSKLKQLQIALKKKGGLPGTKVQIKPMFRKKSEEKSKKHDKEGDRAIPSPFPNPESPVDLVSNGSLGVTDDRTNQNRKESLSDVTLSRAAAAEGNMELEKLQLIVKWGGEPTHSARYQSQELGENLRADLLLMNRDALEDLKVFSSSERRVTTSAQIWTAAFMNTSEVPPDYVHIRKDLLDDSNAAKDEMDKVKKKLKGLLRKGHKAPEQFAWPENMPEPYLVARSVVELMQFHRRVMRENFAKLQGSAVASLAAASLAAAKSGNSFNSNMSSPATGLLETDIQARWCCGEDATLFKERWEKLFDEFTDPEKVDPGKISELHDTIKFDALHNRAFLEWVFHPSQAVIEEFYPSEAPGKDTKPEDVLKAPLRSETGSISSSARVSSSSYEKVGLATRMGWRKRLSVVDPATLRNSANDPDTESYFCLHGRGGDRRAKKSSEADEHLSKLRELFLYSKVLFDFIGPQEYGITDAEKLEIGLLTSLPLLRAIVADIEDMQASEGAKTRVYFTKESHIYTLLNCIIEGGIQTKIDRKKIPELDYLSTICFELYESQNPTEDHETESFNYSIRITISPGCHTFEPLDVQLDSKHCIGFAQRRSLTAHNDYQQVIETLRAKFHTVKLPKSFVAINLSEKVAKDNEAAGDDELERLEEVTGSEDVSKSSVGHGIVSEDSKNVGFEGAVHLDSKDGCLPDTLEGLYIQPKRPVAVHEIAAVSSTTETEGSKIEASSGASSTLFENVDPKEGAVRVVDEK